MPHLTARAAPSFAIHGVDFTSYASSASRAQELAAWRADFAAHTPGQPHRMDREEVMLVLAGQLDVEVGEEHFLAVVGEAVLIPAGALFRVSNLTDEPASAWVTTSLGMSAQMEATGERLSPPWAQ